MPWREPGWGCDSHRGHRRRRSRPAGPDRTGAANQSLVCDRVNMVSIHWLKSPTATVFICLAAAAAANVLVPFMHPVVHGLEAFAAALAVLLVGRLSTKLTQREAELAVLHARAARTERVAALTAFAAGAAHELGTPLSTIAVVVRELERTLPAGRTAEDLQLIRAEVARCRGLLDEMNGGRGAVPETMSVAALIEAIMARLDDASRARVVVRWETSARTVAAPRVVLAQAIAGLVKNAVEASGGAGGTGEVVLGVASRDGHLQLAVKDQGCGMSPAVLERAGEPFFTTKSDSGGRGLGLFLARQVAEGLGGHLFVDSDLDRGTRVLFDGPLEMA